MDEFDFSSIKLNLNQKYALLTASEKIALKQFFFQLPISRFEKENESKFVDCEETPLYQLIMGDIVLVIFIIGMIGNITNIFIYTCDRLRHFVTIKLLCTKLIINTVALILFLPHTLRVLQVWDKNSRANELYFVYYWPFETFIHNLLGFCSSWITVFMTFDCVVTSYSPGYSQMIWNKRNVIIGFGILVCIGSLMGSIYPLNRRVIVSKHNNITDISILSSKTEVIENLERYHQISQIILSISIPLILLVIFSIIIFYRFVIYRKTKSGVVMKLTKEKICVVQTTILTTILFILSEIPAIPVFIKAHFSGITVTNNDISVCRWLTFAHFSSICHASLSFFVYIIFSKRFRTSFLNAFKPIINGCILRFFNWILLKVCKKQRNSIEVDSNNYELSNKRNRRKKSFSQVFQEVAFIKNDEDNNNAPSVTIVNLGSIRTESDNC
uniref:G_PROTEIN_RECEP_F1_2 domain-containing protein n=1 Tax=Parastrongyloides trichosuri TaxID=131310 RepID=A0A0N4ZBC7_PARTI